MPKSDTTRWHEWYGMNGEGAHFGSVLDSLVQDRQNAVVELHTCISLMLICHAWYAAQVQARKEIQKHQKSSGGTTAFDLQIISALHQLKELHVGFCLKNEFEHVSAELREHLGSELGGLLGLQGCSNLEKLAVDFPVSSLQWLPNPAQIRSFSVCGCPELSSLEGLQGCSQLQELWTKGTAVFDSELG